MVDGSVPLESDLAVAAHVDQSGSGVVLLLLTAILRPVVRTIGAGAARLRRRG